MGRYFKRNKCKLAAFPRIIDLFLISLLVLLMSSIALSRDFTARCDTLLIVFTANNNGQLLDCGCEIESPAGLPRRLTAIKQLRREYGEILLFEGGDFLGATDVTSQNRIVLNVYEKFNYNALAFGEQEFWNGLEFIKNAILNRKQLFVSTNLIRNDFTKVLEGKVSRKIQFVNNGFKVNVFALLHKNSFFYFPKSKIPIISFEDVKVHLQSELNKIKDPSSINVVIFHGHRWVLDELIKEFENISIWFSGHESANLNDSWQEVVSPVIVPSGTDGESLELVELIRDENSVTKFRLKRLYLTEDILPDEKLLKTLEKYLYKNSVNLIK